MVVNMSATKEFGRWLDAQLKERRIGRADFAVRTNYESKTIESYIYGQRGPSRQGAKIIADVLGLPPNEVLRRAGHDPLPGGDVPSVPSRADESTARDRTVLRYTQDTSLTQFQIVPVIGSAALADGRITSQVDEVVNVQSQDIEGITRPAMVLMPDASLEGRNIEAGDRLLIEQREGTSPCPADGDIVVLFMADVKYVREWWSNGDGVILRAVAAGFEPVRITGQQLAEGHAIVVGIVRKVERIWAV